MPGTEFDVIIDGTYAKVRRDLEGSYRRRYVRHEIAQNLLSQSEVPALRSRADLGSLYQTSWADGAQWWKPLIGPGNLASYFRSNHMDVWSEPGKVVPMNKLADAANTNIHDNCIIGVGTSGGVYAIGDTNTTNASYKDVYLWTPGSDAFVRETGYHSGIATAEGPVAMVYDPTDGYFYTISDGSDIERFSPGGATQSIDWITTGFTYYAGASIFLQNQNLMLYDGEKLYTVDKSSPAVTSVFNDGMGPDMLNDLGTTGSVFLARKANFQLAISTPQGIYYVKNTRQGGQPVAWIFRVDKDASGNWIGNPIATLPVGNLALDIIYHLGQVIISSTPDWRTFLDNDSADANTDAEVQLYFVGEGGMGALGSVIGDRTMDETPFKLLATRGPYLYIGGHKRLWLYDGIRGGLHSVHAWETELTHGPYVAMAEVLDSDSDSATIFLGRDRITRQKMGWTDDPDTVTNFGDDEVHYTIESNYFDFGFPMESKEINRIELLREAGTTAEWEVWIDADDDGFTSYLADSSGNSYQGGSGLAISGRKFRYKLVYQTKDTSRDAFEALLLTATVGLLVNEWELLLDGSELLNVDNKIQDPEAFLDALHTSMSDETAIVFRDNFTEQEQELDDTGVLTTNVKVQDAEIIKNTPGESLIRVVLRAVAP